MQQARRRSQLTVAIAALGAVAGAIFVASPTFAAAPVAVGSLVRTHNYLPGLNHATRLGPAPKNARLTIGVELTHPDVSGEQAAYRQMYDRHSALFRHFLTPAQYVVRFGVPTAQTRELMLWLHSGGLAIQTVSAPGDYVTARGTTTEIARLMHTSFGSYRVGPFTFIANTIPPDVPADLPVQGVMGLNTLQRVWTPLELAAYNHTAAKAKPAAQPAAGSYLGTLVAQDLWGAYDMPSSDEGQGETAGLFGDGYFNSVISDLRLFESRENLPQVPVQKVFGEGGTEGDYPDNAESVEWELDSQSITGAAPKLSQLDLFFAKTPLDADIAATMATWASDPQGPKQMNASFSECESDPASPVVKGTPITQAVYGVGVGNQMELLADNSLRQASLEGRTLFGSSGDTGGSCPFVILPVIGAGNGVTVQPNPQAGYPNSSAYAVGVGGTVLTTNGTTVKGPNHVSSVHRVNEVSWSLSGGGTAIHTPEPSYQQGVSHVNRLCLTTLSRCRGTPDVAAMSGTSILDRPQSFVFGGGNGYEMSSNGLPFAEGGTSLSTPLMTGMWARIQAASPAVGGVYSGLGFANETFYAIGKSARYHDDFVDMTDSDVPRTGNFTYQNQPGWDYVSGWGVPDVRRIIGDPLADANSAARLTHPAGQRSEQPNVACSVTVTSQPDNAYDFSLATTWPPPSHPQLDMTKASLAMSRDGKFLVATITGPALSPSPFVPEALGSYFYVMWLYKGTTYFAGVSAAETGSVSYVEGHTADNFVYQVDHNLTGGSFSNGTMTVPVPIADFGRPPPGALLTVPYAITGYPGLPFVTFASDTAASGDPGDAVQVGACATGPVVSLPGGKGPGHLATTGAPFGLIGGIGLLLLVAAAAVTRRARRTG